jgi:hypothetical protein
LEKKKLSKLTKVVILPLRTMGHPGPYVKLLGGLRKKFKMKMLDFPWGPVEVSGENLGLSLTGARIEQLATQNILVIKIEESPTPCPKK